MLEATHSNTYCWYEITPCVCSLAGFLSIAVSWLCHLYNSGLLVTQMDVAAFLKN